MPDPAPSSPSSIHPATVGIGGTILGAVLNEAAHLEGWERVTVLLAVLVSVVLLALVARWRAVAVVLLLLAGAPVRADPPLAAPVPARVELRALPIAPVVIHGEVVDAAVPATTATLCLDVPVFTVAQRRALTITGVVLGSLSALSVTVAQTYNALRTAGMQ